MCTIKREPLTHSGTSFEANSRLSFPANHNNSQHSVAPCNPWLYTHHHHPHPHQHSAAESMVNSLDSMTAILPSSMSSSFLDQLPNHAHHTYSNSSQAIVQSSSSPDSLTGDSVSIVSNMARRASATYPSSSSHHPSHSSNSAAPLSSSDHSPLSHFNDTSLVSPYNRPLCIRTSNLHHQQSQSSHNTDDVDCDDLTHNSRTASTNPHHSHFIYAFQCSLCDTKDDVRP